MIEGIESLSGIPVSDLCTWENGVPVYHKEIEAFFRFDDFWIIRDYNLRMKELKEKRIAEMNLDEIKTRLTAINRSEKFNYGAWERIIRDGVLAKIRTRLKELKV